MAQADIRFACQTYSWQMSGERYRGCLEHIATVAAAAGFPALEPEAFMLDGYRESRRLHAVLADHGMELASVALACQWRHARETDEEVAEADEIIELVGSFSGAKLVLVQLPGRDRSELRVRQEYAINCMNAVGRRALDAGVRPTVHPNSPQGSVFRDAADYEVLLDKLDARIGFTPDLGHVAAGGMDPLEVVRLYRARVDHMHLKDVDGAGNWVPTGKGSIDFAGTVGYLAESGYRGWVVLEDESEDAHLDPDGAAGRNALYVQEVLVPACESGRRENSLGNDKVKEE